MREWGWVSGARSRALGSGAMLLPTEACPTPPTFARPPRRVPCSPPGNMSALGSGKDYRDTIPVYGDRFVDAAMVCSPTGPRAIFGILDETSPDRVFVDIADLLVDIPVGSQVAIVSAAA